MSLLNGTQYMAQGRPCPSCKATQPPQADNIQAPVLRTCACGFRWHNAFRDGKLVGYDPKARTA